MPSFHSAGTLPVDHTLVMTLCKALLIGFSAPFRSSAVMPVLTLSQITNFQTGGETSREVAKCPGIKMSEGAKCPGGELSR